MLDKEVLVVPVVTGTISLVVAIVGYVGGYLLSNEVQTTNDLVTYAEAGALDGLSAITYTVWIATSAILALLSTYTLAAVVSISLQRLRGEDPTIRSGLARVQQKFGALTAFGLLSFGIVQALQIIQDRLPFTGGRIVAFLGEMAWRVAAFFAVPIIVDNDQSIGPFTAAKQSLSTIRRTWKEAAVSQFGIGFVIMLVAFAEIFVGMISIFLAVSVAGTAGGVVIGILVGLLLLVTMLVSSVLTGIARAALYYFASTGEAPASFDKQLLREAFTAKKARKIFS